MLVIKLRAVSFHVTLIFSKAKYYLKQCEESNKSSSFMSKNRTARRYTINLLKNYKFENLNEGSQGGFGTCL